MSGSARTPVEGVPEFTVVDALAVDLSAAEQRELLGDLSAIHGRYFPSYPHVVREFEQQVLTGDHPPGERVHAFLVQRDGAPVGEWVMAVDRRAGVIMMLFGAIHREARIDLDRGYLVRLVDDLLGRCVAAAADDGEDIVAVILESDGPHLGRWHELGFFTADPDYREPIHGRHWPQHGEPAFFDRYAACVRPWGRGMGMARSVLAERALTALLVDHYGMPADHPQVVRSLAAAAALR